MQRLQTPPAGSTTNLIQDAVVSGEYRCIFDEARQTAALAREKEILAVDMAALADAVGDLMTQYEAAAADTARAPVHGPQQEPATHAIAEQHARSMQAAEAAVTVAAAAAATAAATSDASTAAHAALVTPAPATPAPTTTEEESEGTHALLYCRAYDE